MRIGDRVVVVTGASSGIGRATALAFARRGCALALAARREEALRDVARECAERGGEAIAVPVDVTDADAVDRLARRAVERYGRIDVWVNDAAVGLFAPFQDVPLGDIARVFDVDVMGYVYGSRAALRVMREQGHGTLINVSSVVGVVSQPYTHAYGMANAAIRSLGGSLRQELRLDKARGIHVCTVLPATIDTPLFQHAANYTGRRVLAMPPVYTPERVARTIVKLARVPQREVVVGPLARGLVWQARVVPGFAERVMATQVQRRHLSRTKPAPATAGNLYAPPDGPGSAHGAWGGRRRTALRRAGAAAALVGATAAGRRVLR